MDTTRACILIMDAFAQATDREHGEGRHFGDAPYGVFIVDNARSGALGALRTVVETLDYRIEVMDADRTNLNDLEVWNSPMREKARFAYASDRTYVFVLRGWVAAMGKDPRIDNYRASFGGAGRAVILSDTAMGVPENFVVCDLSAL
jgi:hypothetical protein